MDRTTTGGVRPAQAHDPLDNMEAFGRQLVGCAADARLLRLYEAYLAARDEWHRLAGLPNNGNWDDPRSLAADTRRRAALEALGDMVPASMAGIAALAHVLWLEHGPAFVPGTEERDKEIAEPEHRLIAAIWRGAALTIGESAS